MKGRICALRKTDEAIEEAHTKICQTAQRTGKKPREETLRFARCVFLFTHLPMEMFSATTVLESYRLRWQVELAFKRFKSLAKLGHLPKFDDERAKAWLYGKLRFAPLTEKIVRNARTLPSWGYDVRVYIQYMEGIQVRPQPSRAGG